MCVDWCCKILHTAFYKTLNDYNEKNIILTYLIITHEHHKKLLEKRTFRKLHLYFKNLLVNILFPFMFSLSIKLHFLISWEKSKLNNLMNFFFKKTICSFIHTLTVFCNTNVNVYLKNKIILKNYYNHVVILLQ